MNKYENNTKNDATESTNILHNLTNVGLKNVKKLTKLQLKMSSDAIEQASNTIKTLTSTKNPQQLLQQVNEIAKDKMKTNNDNFKDFVAIVNETRAEFLQASIENFKSLKQANMHNLSTMLTKFQKLDSNTRKAVDHFNDSTKAVLNGSKKLADKNTKSASEAIDSVNTAVKNTPHPVAKTNKVKTTPHKKPIHKETAKAATEDTKKVAHATDKAADKVVDEAKKVV